MTGWDQIIIEPVKNMIDKIMVFVPVLLGALIILLVGWIVAKIISGVIQKALDALKFNDFSAKIGLTDMLTKGGVSHSPTLLLSSVVYWAIMIIVLAITVDAIGLQVAANLLERITGYIPNVVSAIFVVIIGMFFAKLVSGVIRTAAANANVPRVELLGSIAKGAILLFTTVIVLEELSIASFFVTTTFQLFFGAACFAFALAFGLGGKDLAAKLLWDFFNKQNMNK